MGRSVQVSAPAKLNLALAVVGKRGDGFHDLESIFTTVDLADDVRVADAKRLEVRNSIDLGAAEDLAARAVRA
ncbi:MAG TPA: 4-(cytidine 5'-diphospho)-2-C-methyl-D-erythritol kinase, partial [Candidatus Limnocylindria bacterium]|nr:4-(cytidine 5'-diphospho)-2-C-methyl-D-erythritol kinase [Candidatus Limnocylindria bacterium]